MALIDSILDDGVGIEAIASYLDGLSHDQRLAETRGLDRNAQRKLYVKAAESPPIDLAHFVPSERADLDPVRHDGRNTLPLPGRHRLFAKMFCRPKDGTSRLFGYNDAPSRWMVGPGYFVGVPTEGHRTWQDRGGVVIDYFQVPDGPVAAGWPRVVRNTQGLQRFVYDGTRDYMRKVSAHVSIGAAYKGDKPLDHYFVLCRECG